MRGKSADFILFLSYVLTESCRYKPTGKDHVDQSHILAEAGYKNSSLGIGQEG